MKLTDDALFFIKKYRTSLKANNLDEFFDRLVSDSDTWHYDSLTSEVSDLFLYMLLNIPDFLSYLSFIPQEAFVHSTSQELDMLLRYRSFKLPSNIILLDPYAFEEAHITELDLSNTGIKELPEGCFSKCNIGRVILPNALETISTDSFKDCYIKDEYPIFIPDSVTNIEQGAFYDVKCPMRFQFSESNEYLYNYFSELIDWAVTRNRYLSMELV